MLQHTRSTKGCLQETTVSREEFGRIVTACSLSYSVAWTDATYEICLGEGQAAGLKPTADLGEESNSNKRKGAKQEQRTLEEFCWTFCTVLNGARDDCDDVFCRPETYLFGVDQKRRAVDW